jgi:hypothetical protein
MFAGAMPLMPIKPEKQGLALGYGGLGHLMKNQKQLPLIPANTTLATITIAELIDQGSVQIKCSGQMW